MAVRLRLQRVGGRKKAIWRVVVSDQRSPRDGRVIEMIGRYNPQVNPSLVEVNEARARYWLDRGAQPTRTVRKLLNIHEAGSRGARGPETSKLMSSH